MLTWHKSKLPSPLYISTGDRCACQNSSLLSKCIIFFNTGEWFCPASPAATGQDVVLSCPVASLVTINNAQMIAVAFITYGYLEYLFSVY